SRRSARAHRAARAADTRLEVAQDLQAVHRRHRAGHLRRRGSQKGERAVKIGAIYARVSTGAQAAEDKIRLVDQERECRELAKREGYEIPKHLVFIDRVSGTLDEAERPAFGRMLDAARRGEFGKLYFFRVDRLGRDQAIISGALRDLAKAKVEFVSVRD